MPRTNKVEQCIFCAQTPCACNKAGKRESKPKTSTKHETPAKGTRFKSRVASKPSVTVVTSDPQPTTRFSVEEESQEELELKIAVRNLEPILSEGSKKTYRHLLDSKSGGVERRLHDWREQHGTKARVFPSNGEA